MEIIDEKKYLKALRLKFDSYSPLTDTSWEELEQITQFVVLAKEELLLGNGNVSPNIYFVCKGSLRAFFTDLQGNIYTKNIFVENNVAGSLASTIQRKPSEFTLESLENDTILIALNYNKFRQLIEKHTDLKNFYISYIEQHWIIEKEKREISLVMEDAIDRYRKFLDLHPNIEKRISLHHIASHLGITSTQLSRIRKKMKDISKNQHM